MQEEWNALGQHKIYKYDQSGNVISEEVPASGQLRKFAYDYMNRLIRQEDHVGQGKMLVTTHRYNYLNHRVATVDHYGNETRYVYDDFGRVSKVHYPAVVNENGEKICPTVSKEYDAMGNVTAVTDALGRTTRAAYTAYRKPYLIQYPDGAEARSEYNLRGQLKRSFARDGSSVVYEYDNLGRPTKKELYAADGSLAATSMRIYHGFHLKQETAFDGQKTHYSYDGAGRLIRLEKGDKRSDYHYDALGRQSEVREYLSPDALYGELVPIRYFKSRGTGRYQRCFRCYL